VYAVFLGIVLLHGLVIWQEPLERALALGEVVAVVVLTVHLVRRGAFAPRAVVELRQESRDQDTANLYVTAVGRVCAARVRLDYADGLQRWAVQGFIGTFSELRAASLEVPAQAARELKVWAHRVTPAGLSEPLSVRLAVLDGADVRRIDLAAHSGQIVVPLTGRMCLELLFDHEGLPAG
jgi:hypothetical protein